MTYTYDFDHKHPRPPMELKDLLGGDSWGWSKA